MQKKSIQQDFSKCIQFLERELAGIRTGRAKPSLVEAIPVEYYGTATPLVQLATISAPEPRLLVIEAWDASVIPNVEKALRQSDLGLNPAVDGLRIRLPIPPLSEERRLEMVKIVKHKAETARISVRNTREEFLKQIKRDEKAGALSEDGADLQRKELQKLTDGANSQIDEIVSAKEKEILTV